MSNPGLAQTLRRAGATVIAGTALAAGGIAPTMSAPAQAAPPGSPTLPAAFDLAQFTPVNPTPYQSVAYADNGRWFFTTGRWMCQLGPSARSVGCQGHPATAPPRVDGAAITNDAQGPWWVPSQGQINAPTYRFGSAAGFRPPLLAVGRHITVGGVTCTVPSPTQVACRTGERALIFTSAWHKFYFPSGDTAHAGNPAPRYLPPPLQYWNQLPATPPAPW